MRANERVDEGRDEPKGEEGILCVVREAKKERKDERMKSGGKRRASE